METILNPQKALEKQLWLLHEWAKYSTGTTEELIEISSTMAEIAKAIMYPQGQAFLSNLKRKAESEIKEPIPPLPKQENNKKAPPDKPAQEGQNQRELTVEEIKEQLVGALYEITVQLLKEEPVPADLDKIEQIRRNTDTIIRLMDYLV